MTSEAGRHSGTRKAPPSPRAQVKLGMAAALSVGLTIAVVAWGYLAWLAVDFGTTARAGTSSAWWFLALASLGAMACLFVGLLLVARLARALGLVGATPAAPRAPGGRRRAG